VTNSEVSNLRILLVIESSGGGSARHVVDLAGGLLAQGHHVEVVYSPLRADAWFVRDLEALPGIVIYPLEMRRSVGLHDFLSARKLQKLIVSCAPFDIIHGHSAKAGALIRLAGIGISGRKIYTPHAFITLDPNLGAKKRFIYTVVERLLAKYADGIICVSQEEEAHAIELGISKKLLFTVENGLVPLSAGDREAARKSLGLKETDVCLGFVGRISGQKPVDRMIRAFHLLHLQYPDLVVAIVGEGPDYESVQELAHSLNISDRVRFTGAAEGIFMMSGFDVFVLPSSYEAFPYVYLEALYRGLPIITTDVGGSSAVVAEGVNGYIVPQVNLNRMVACMAELAERPELRAEMGANSLEKSREFTVTHMVNKTIDIYRQLCLD
jgi:glycosyltransferase involved in cell wall biosynthesis